MFRRTATLLTMLCPFMLSLAGCAAGGGHTYLVSFLPFSATPDPAGQATLDSAIAYAKANKLAPVTIDGFRMGQYTNEVDSLSEERVRVTIYRLVQGGIGRERIDTMGKGLDYAQGSPMPALPPDTVKVGVGL